MNEVTIPGDPPIALNLRRSAQAKRMTLRVSRLDGRVTLSMPRGTSRRAALAFANEKADWIRGHLAQGPEARLLRPGGVLPLEGRQVTLRAGPVRAPRLEEAEDNAGGPLLIVPARAPERTGPRLRAFLKTRARDRLAPLSSALAGQLGREVGALSLRDPRSRWGSCSSAGRLMFSWRLIMAPPEVLHYVAVHEVAHLVEMNHSPAFWDLVGLLMPDFPENRDWLRQNGPQLHAFRFDD